MIRSSDPENETTRSPGPSMDADSELPAKKKLTLFAAPKAFEGHTAVIQQNAIASWTQLAEHIDIFLFGDEFGIAEMADSMSVRHFPDVRRNDSGTPQLDSIFEQAIDAAQTPYVMYVNSDIIFNTSLVETVEVLCTLNLDSFLAIGQRTDFDQPELIDFDAAEWEPKLSKKISTNGKLASILCKDYFIFPQNRFRDIPAFSIGRGNWDNWMVAQMTKTNSPVIDVTAKLLAGHQNHEYGHAGGRMKAYVTGDEAQKNKQLAGGTNYIAGSVATHKLNASGKLQITNRFPLLSFVKDFPRIAKLVYKLFKQ